MQTYISPIGLTLTLAFSSSVPSLLITINHVTSPSLCKAYSLKFLSSAEDSYLCLFPYAFFFECE